MVEFNVEVELLTRQNGEAPEFRDGPRGIEDNGMTCKAEEFRAKPIRGKGVVLYEGFVALAEFRVCPANFLVLLYRLGPELLATIGFCNLNNGPRLALCSHPRVKIMLFFFY
jgi:hypothetical protein